MCAAVNRERWKKLLFFLCKYNFFKDFIYLFIHDRQRERQRHRQREKRAPFREPDVGLDPGTPRSRPGPKAGAEPIRHPGIPGKGISLG